MVVLNNKYKPLNKPLALWQEITLALALKVALLTLIWLAWFSPTHEIPVDTAQVASHLIHNQQYKEQSHDAVAGAR